MSKVHYKKVKIDEWRDHHGNFIIRFDDGTPNGDITREPIATVYSENAANIIVAALNASNVVVFLNND